MPRKRIHDFSNVEVARDAYEHKRAEAARISRRIATAGRDIGSIPKPVHRSRKSRCARNFKRFCESYFPLTFELAWSDDHLDVIAQIEQSVMRGGLFAHAMPRGSGKTTLAEKACLWAALYGHRDFIALVGSDESHALDMLAALKAELENNERLAEDFPEAVYPILCLEGIAQRCQGQTCEGARTHIGWTADEIVLPTIKGSKASGAIVKVAGLTGGLRGMKFRRPDDRTVRPSLVVIDDPQTDESARSPRQCETRERILAGAVLGLAGPGKKISGIMPCTVISRGDLADRILDRTRNPDWNGKRSKLLYEFPADQGLWAEYARLRAEGLMRNDEGRAATEYYRANRAAMDRGARVAWPARHNADELSALQHCMNLKLRDERAFFAEYQNEPMAEPELVADELSAGSIAERLHRLARGRVPSDAEHLTAFIDVQASLLYWLVVGWKRDFTGYVLDYGTWPEQHRAYFTLADARLTFALRIKGAGLEGQIYAALGALVGALAPRDWHRDDGSLMRVERCLIDAGWGMATDVVRRFCRQSPHGAILTPSHGIGIGANGRPMDQWQKRPGERVGHNWRLRSAREGGGVRALMFDSNFWKSFLRARLSTAIGDPGALTLFGEKADAHRMLADHLIAEYREPTTAAGRTVDVWKIRPERPDNHLLDCLVGSAVAASMQGAALVEGPSSRPAARRRVSFAEMQARHRQARA